MHKRTTEMIFSKSRVQINPVRIACQAPLKLTSIQNLVSYYKLKIEKILLDCSHHIIDDTINNKNDNQEIIGHDYFYLSYYTIQEGTVEFSE